MESKSKRQRVIGTKYSKNACRTCRIRRVKCDEAKPQCRCCVSTGRSCDGYNPSATSSHLVASQRPLLPSATPSPAQSLTKTSPLSCRPFDTNADDRRSFQYFVQNLAISMTCTMQGSGLISFALQLAMTEPAIYYAISAVGSAATRRIGISISHGTVVIPSSSINREAALEQYCKATASLQKYIDRAVTSDASIEPVLICCLLFVTYEMFQGKTWLALSHLRHGRRAIEHSVGGMNDSETRSKDGRLRCLSRQIAGEIFAVFDWLGSESSIFGLDLLPAGSYESESKKIPYSFDCIRFTSVENAKQVLDHLIAGTSRWRSDLLQLAERRVATTAYASFRQAFRSCIAHCLSRSMDLPPKHPLLQRQAELTQGLEAWLAAAAELEDGKQGNSIHPSITLMRIQHFFFSFVLKTSRTTIDILTDHYGHVFEHVLQMIEHYIAGASSCPLPLRPERLHSSIEPQKSFSLEYSILPALFFICLKCRSFDLRRRALSLLSTAKRREGSQWSDEWAVYAESLITIEGISATGKKSDHIPEKARLLDIIIEDVGPLEVRVICGRYMHEEDGRLEITEYRGSGLPPLRLQHLATHIIS